MNGEVVMVETVYQHIYIRKLIQCGREGDTAMTNPQTTGRCSSAPNGATTAPRTARSRPSARASPNGTPFARSPNPLAPPHTTWRSRPSRATKHSAPSPPARGAGAHRANFGTRATRRTCPDRRRPSDIRGRARGHARGERARVRAVERRRGQGAARSAQTAWAKSSSRAVQSHTGCRSTVASHGYANSRMPHGAPSRMKSHQSIIPETKLEA